MSLASSFVMGVRKFELLASSVSDEIWLPFPLEPNRSLGAAD